MARPRGWLAFSSLALLLSAHHKRLQSADAVAVQVNGEAMHLKAASLSDIGATTINFVQYHNLSTGGGCQVLPDLSRRRACVGSLIASTLASDMFKEAISSWPQREASLSSATCQWWLARFFTHGDGYTRRFEMVFRDVATSSAELSSLSVSFLRHLSALPGGSRALVNLTLAFILDHIEVKSDRSNPVLLPPVPTRSPIDYADRSALCVVSVATSQSRALRRMNASVAANGLRLHILGLGMPWRGHGMKMTLLEEFLGSAAARGECDKDVLFLDAYDTLMLRAPAGLLQARFRAMGCGILFNGEVDCAPDRSLRELWPAHDSSTPLPFLNSGVFIGKASVIREMLRAVREDLALNFGVVDMQGVYQADDQRLYSRWFLRHQHVARVDASGMLFHTLHGFSSDSFVASANLLGPGAIWSHISHTSPLIVHGNGNGCSVLLSIVAQLEGVDWPPAVFLGKDPPRPVHAVEWRDCEWPFNSH